MDGITTKLGRARGSGGDRFHVDFDFEGMGAAAKDEAAEGADVGVVASPGDGDVSVGGGDVVGGVHVEPAGGLAEGGEPGVGGVGADEAGFAGGG